MFLVLLRAEACGAAHAVESFTGKDKCRLHQQRAESSQQLWFNRTHRRFSVCELMIPPPPVAPRRY
eukprot:4050469-Amphidinium_carterae.1